MWSSCDIDDREYNLKFGFEPLGSKQFALLLIGGGGEWHLNPIVFSVNIMYILF